MSAAAVVAHIILAIFASIMIIFGTSFAYFMYKQVHPVKARSKILITGQYIGMLAVFFQYYLIVTRGESSDCSIDLQILSILSYLLVVSLLLRSIRLLIIFTVTKRRLEHPEDDQRFGNFLISERFMALLLFVGAIIFCLYRALALVILSNKHGFVTACSSGFTQYSSAALVVLILIGFVIVGIKLRRVHDAYFIKKEFKLMIVNCIVLGIPGIALYANESTQDWGVVLILLVSPLLAVYSYLIPSLKSYQNYKELQRSSSASMSELPTKSSSGIADDDFAVVENTRTSVFVKFPKIVRLLNNPMSDKFIKSYILHYQDVLSPDYLNFCSQAAEFRQLAPEYRAGKGYLLFQKYIATNSYRFIACVSDEQRSEIETRLTEAMEENGPTVSETLFDDVLDTLEMELVERLYKPFLDSEYFLKYQEANALSVELA